MTASAKKRVGRYEVYAEIASGGMATVHFGRQLGHVGFSRAVAIKRLHPHIAKDPSFVGMFLDEARLATRIRHPNVVQTLDVVAAGGELILVMDYVHGESLARLLGTMAARKERVDPQIAVAIGIGMLEGLHAAHEAKNERGAPLEIVHRDVSPQNVLVGVDGVPRVFDFGIAKAVDRLHTTQDGSLKGKIAYMSPEQLDNQPIDRRTDIWAASVVLWETLVGKRLFVADSQAALVRVIMTKEVPLPSSLGCPPELDAVLARGLAKDPDERFATAGEMALALEQAFASAPARSVARWVENAAKSALDSRMHLLDAIDRGAAEERPSGRTRVEVDAFLDGQMSAPVSGQTRSDPALSEDASSGIHSAPRQRLSASPMTAPGTTLRFSVLGELAAGGMGRVDLARCEDADAGLGLVAVKRLLPLFAMDPEFVRMFESEASLTGALDHPNIVGLVGFGTDEEGLFLATELVRGGSLSQLERIRKRMRERAPLDLVAFVGARVATALAAAHALAGPDGQLLQVVHRDVSFGNVLIGVRGEVKLTDFGVAKACANATHTATGVLKGKAHYLAPEYVRGETVDSRSDLFSLGVLLYQLASGKRPFEGTNDPEIIQRILAGSFAPLATCAPGIDPALAAIVDRLLSRDPARRSPGGATALAIELLESMAMRGQKIENVEKSLGAYAERYGASQLARIRDLERAASDDTMVDEAPDRPTLPPSHARRGGAPLSAAANASGKVLRLTLPMRTTLPLSAFKGTLALSAQAYAPRSSPSTAPSSSPHSTSTVISARPASPSGSVASFSGSGRQSTTRPSLSSERAALAAVIGVAAVVTLVAAYSVVRHRPSTSQPSADPAPTLSVSVPPALPLSLPLSPSLSLSPAVSLAPAPAPAAPDATPAPPSVVTHRKGAPSAKPGPRCTSFDFDYPACLKR